MSSKTADEFDCETVIKAVNAFAVRNNIPAETALQLLGLHLVDRNGVPNPTGINPDIFEENTKETARYCIRVLGQYFRVRCDDVLVHLNL